MARGSARLLLFMLCVFGQSLYHNGEPVPRAIGARVVSAERASAHVYEEQRTARPSAGARRHLLSSAGKTQPSKASYRYDGQLLKQITRKVHPILLRAPGIDPANDIMVHLVVTNFLANQYCADDLAQARLAQLAKLAAPSLENQSRQAFIWVVLADPLLPHRVKRRLEDVVHGHRQHHTHILYTDQFEMQTQTNAIAGRDLLLALMQERPQDYGWVKTWRPAVTHVLTTQVAASQAPHRRLVEALQAQAYAIARREHPFPQFRYLCWGEDAEWHTDGEEERGVYAKRHARPRPGPAVPGQDAGGGACGPCAVTLFSHADFTSLPFQWPLHLSVKERVMEWVREQRKHPGWLDYGETLEVETNRYIVPMDLLIGSKNNTELYNKSDDGKGTGAKYGCLHMPDPGSKGQPYSWDSRDKIGSRQEGVHEGSQRPPANDILDMFGLQPGHIKGLNRHMQNNIQLLDSNWESTKCRLAQRCKGSAQYCSGGPKPLIETKYQKGVWPIVKLVG